MSKNRVEIFDKTIQEVTQQRGEVYGHPRVDFDRAVRIQKVIAECDDVLVRHALDRIALKIARLIQTPDHLDSWIDIAGYCRCALMCMDAMSPDE